MDEATRWQTCGPCFPTSILEHWFMAEETTPSRSTIIQWVALALVLAAGLVLFFRLAPVTGPVVDRLAP